MRLYTLIRSLALLLAASFMCTAMAPGQETVVDWLGPPSTFAALVKGARVIVRAQVLSLGAPQVIEATPTELVGRFVDVKVSDILKQPIPHTLAVGQTLRVLQWGGSAEVGQRLAQTRYPDRVFEVGEDDVLFLIQHDSSTWALPFHQSSCQFRFSSTGEITVPNPLLRVPELASASTLSISTLRSLVGAVR